MARSTPTPIELGPLARRTIALCGFMGVGKSTVGRRLAHRLDRTFVDVDLLLVERLGASIPALFGTGKEMLFRETEAEAIAELSASAEPLVIALGGGAYDDERTRAVLRDHAFTIHLDQSWEALTPAISHLRATRPLMQGRTVEEIHQLYDRRRANYLRADLSVAIPRSGVGVATRAVIDALIAYVNGAAQ